MDCDLMLLTEVTVRECKAETFPFWICLNSSQFLEDVLLIGNALSLTYTTRPLVLTLKGYHRSSHAV